MQWISDNNSLNNGEFTSEDELGKQVIILICIRFKLWNKRRMNTSAYFILRFFESAPIRGKTSICTNRYNFYCLWSKRECTSKNFQTVTECHPLSNLGLTEAFIFPFKNKKKNGKKDVQETIFSEGTFGGGIRSNCAEWWQRVWGQRSLGRLKMIILRKTMNFFLPTVTVNNPEQTRFVSTMVFRVFGGEAPNFRDILWLWLVSWSEERILPLKQRFNCPYPWLFIDFVLYLADMNWWPK